MLKTLQDRFGGLSALKHLTPPELERSFKSATKVNHELSTSIEME